MKEPIVIKPHHFLDIIKLYGEGYNTFLPDKMYGHDFYKIGNIILNDKKTLLTLTLNSDDICKPCKYLKNLRCIDIVANNALFKFKEEWNKVIDGRLMMKLGLSDRQIITALEFCLIANNKLENIFEIWKEEDDRLTIIRKEHLFKGIIKYLRNNFED